MELLDLSKGLLEALEKFDEETLPLGLYASDELVAGKALKPQYQEWARAIFPYLASQGCSYSKFYPRSSMISESLLGVPGTGSVRLTLVKLSNIKVRKYGSGYHVDKHEQRAERWKQVDLSGHISELWKQPNPHSWSPDLRSRILLFVGFDKSQRPFERELADLQQSLHWEAKTVLYATHTWQDKASRGFNVRLSVWARSL